MGTVGSMNNSVGTQLRHQAVNALSIDYVEFMPGFIEKLSRAREKGGMHSCPAFGSRDHLLSQFATATNHQYPVVAGAT